MNKSNVPDEEELNFTTLKISNNFSNYSSWHYRSKLLKKLYPSSINDLPIRDDVHNTGKKYLLYKNQVSIFLIFLFFQSLI